MNGAQMHGEAQPKGRRKAPVPPAPSCGKADQATDRDAREGQPVRQGQNAAEADQPAGQEQRRGRQEERDGQRRKCQRLVRQHGGGMAAATSATPPKAITAVTACQTTGQTALAGSGHCPATMGRRPWGGEFSHPPQKTWMKSSSSAATPAAKSQGFMRAFIRLHRVKPGR